MKPFIRAVMTVVAMLAATVVQAAPESRVALVLGNARYPDAPLKNAANDARAMATTLRERGFNVILRVDANKTQMETAIIEFGEKLSEGATGLFFFAGHGMQVQGRNYIVPIDAKLTSEQRIKLEAVDVDAVLDQMQGARSKFNVVILDACRNNPFERRFRSASGGLAQINAPEGTLIAYATAPGRVAADGEGANGLYTTELLKALRAPGLKVEDVFKQVRINVARASNGAQTPWEASSLVGDFYFIPPAPAAAPTNTAEFEFWNTIRNSNEAGEYRAYLSRYPKGEFADLAQMRLATIEKSRSDAVERARSDAVDRARAEAAERARLAAIEKARLEATEKARAEAAEQTRIEIEKIRREAAERARIEVEKLRSDAAQEHGRTAGLASPSAPLADQARQSDPRTASQRLALGLPITYADLAGRQYFAQQNYVGGHRGFEIRFDFSGSEPGRITVHGRIEIDTAAGRSSTTLPFVSCPIHGFDRFTKSLRFESYCTGNLMVVGDLSTMSATFTQPGLNPTPVIVIDSTYADSHREWTKGVRDNNTAAFFQSVLKESLIRSAAARN